MYGIGGGIVCVYDVSNRLNTVECLLTQNLFPNGSQTHLSRLWDYVSYIHTAGCEFGRETTEESTYMHMHGVIVIHRGGARS
jgi:hypothetical protein